MLAVDVTAFLPLALFVMVLAAVVVLTGNRRR